MVRPGNKPASHGQCCVCGRSLPAGSLHPVAMLGQQLLGYLSDNQAADPSAMICAEDRSRLRMKLVHDLLLREQGELADDAREVLASLDREGELISRDSYGDFDASLSLGQRIADRVADFGGSWAFIIMFLIILGTWIIINSIHLLKHPFDPFPYILLNLLLSCVAALQAPVIMMSQNRKEARDRMRSENDYRVNLKAELEIRSLQAKLDILISHQWQRLLEIQEIQTQMLDELAGQQSKGNAGH
ncbi:DUF1003 domain-containing protein [bacterium]|nr:DUF1003 domain-containing protein [bacterium]